MCNCAFMLLFFVHPQFYCDYMYSANLRRAQYNSSFMYISSSSPNGIRMVNKKSTLFLDFNVLFEVI